MCTRLAAFHVVAVVGNTVGIKHTDIVIAPEGGRPAFIFIGYADIHFMRRLV